MKTEKIIKAIKKETKAITKSNAVFNKMTPAQKRVAIAKDVLSQIRSKKITPKHLEYYQNKAAERKKLCSAIKSAEPNSELRDVLKKVPSCNVCARGAIFVSAIKLFNNFAVKKLGNVDEDFPIDTDSIFSIGGRYFSKKQALLIEVAFEGRIDVLDYDERDALSNDQYDAAVDFYKSFKNAKDRMVGIMKNIIKNKGEFVI